MEKRPAGRHHVSIPTDRLPPLEAREIIVAHDPDAGPLTAVKNVVIQSSIAQLRTHGHFERYAKLVNPAVLEQLLAEVAPSWIPIAIVDQHYEACDNLMLSDDELVQMGFGVGNRVQETSFVTSAKSSRDDDFDMWSTAGSLRRLWARLYLGGSIQVTRLGPKDKLLEQRGFSLNRHRYYRLAQVASFRASHEALGVQLTCLKIVSYSASRDEIAFRLIWA